MSWVYYFGFKDFGCFFGCFLGKALSNLAGVLTPEVG